MTEPPYDLGVLVVHGIGDQHQGGTLREFNALVDCAERWLPHSVVAGEPRAQVSETPAHMTIALADVGGTPMRVLVAEGHWADTVEPPGTWTLLKWLSSVVPFVVPRVLDGQIRRRSERMDVVARWRPRYLVDGAVRLVLNVGTVLATLIVLVSLFVLWLIALPRVAFDDLTRKRRGEPHDPLWVAVLGIVLLAVIFAVAIGLGGIAGRAGVAVAFVAAVGIGSKLSALLNSVVARFIGDCYALLRRPEDERRMVDRVAARLAWLQARVQQTGTQQPTPVVVVAHSQGAEVVRRVIADRGASVEGLVTLGSGIEKLTAVGLLRERPWRSTGLLLLRAVSAALVVVAGLAVLPWPSGISVWVALAAVPVAWLLLQRVRMALRKLVWEDYTAEMLGVGGEQVRRWADFYAHPDPVPEGDLPIATWGRSQAIANGRVFLLDHIRYWHNVQAFLAPVALELARIAGRDPDPELWPAVRKGGDDRAKALAVCVRLRWAVVAALLALAGTLVFGAGTALVALAAAATVAAVAVLRIRATAARRLAFAWSPCPAPD